MFIKTDLTLRVVRIRVGIMLAFGLLCVSFNTTSLNCIEKWTPNLFCMFLLQKPFDIIV